jgi:hypothetical protein
MIPPPFRCQSCAAGALHEIPGFAALPRVTSDSKPFRAGGRLFVCTQCALVQKAADPKWLAEIGEIYRDYEMYHQSESHDQPVFDPASGRPSGRCEVLSRRLRASGLLPESGTLLDVGAGAGAMLTAFSAARPGWTLHGLDLDDRRRAMLEAIPRFERLHTVPPERLDRRFDLVTLIHSLEHFTEPLDMLRRLRERLEPQGALFVEVNDVDRMPFDLVVADHLCHFTPATLAGMTTRAGLQPALLAEDWVRKELSLLARPLAGAAAPQPDPSEAIARLQAEVAWLRRMLDAAREAARAGRFGIFGTSIAATWLACALGDAVDFFVDEDEARQGREHLGRPILAPAQAAPGSTVYLAFVREAADAILRRLGGLPLRFAVPDPA